MVIVMVMTALSVTTHVYVMQSVSLTCFHYHGNSHRNLHLESYSLHLRLSTMRRQEGLQERYSRDVYSTGSCTYSTRKRQRKSPQLPRQEASSLFARDVKLASAPRESEYRATCELAAPSDADDEEVEDECLALAWSTPGTLRCTKRWARPSCTRMPVTGWSAVRPKDARLLLRSGRRREKCTPSHESARAMYARSRRPTAGRGPWASVRSAWVVGKRPTTEVPLSTGLLVAAMK